MTVSLTGVLTRFWLGLACGAAAGFAVYRMEIFDPLTPTFRVLTMGSTFAGVMALWRSEARGHAWALGAAYALFSLGFVSAYGWVTALSGTALALGLVAITAIFDRLAGRIRVGKFVLTGVLLGVLLYAATPMIEFREMIPLASLDAMKAYGQLGLVLGAGVGFGVEVSDSIVRHSENPRV